jgi:hypothetical protein
MTTIVKKKSPIVVPESLLRRAGIKGDHLIFTLGRHHQHHSGVPSADDEYTPAQRRIIDAQLAEARKGPYYGPFNTADEMIAHAERRAGKESSGEGLSAALYEGRL